MYVATVRALHPGVTQSDGSYHEGDAYDLVLCVLRNTNLGNVVPVYTCPHHQSCPCAIYQTKIQYEENDNA